MLRSQVLRVSFSSWFGNLSCVFQRFPLSLLLRRGSFDNSRVESDEWNVFIKRPTRIMNDPIDNNLMPTLHTEMFPRYMHLRRSIRKKHRLIRPCLINPFYRAPSLFPPARYKSPEKSSPIQRRNYCKTDKGAGSLCIKGKRYPGRSLR